MMFHLGRWSGPALGRKAGRLAATLALLLAVAEAEARDVVVSGSNMNRFGRILLQFDQPTKVSARVSNSVLIITFAEPAKVKTEKLTAEIPSYVSTVRRDPDGTGLRLALSGPVKPNVLEAAERVFIDLLPPNWTGMLPGLPPEVVAELAARVAEAEAKLKAAGPRQLAKPVRLRLAQLPTLTRLQFDTPEGLPVQIKETGEQVELVFPGPASFEDGGAKPKLAAGIEAFDVARVGTGFAVRVKRAADYVAQSFREPDGIVLDVAKPQPPQVLPEAAPSEAAAEAPPPPKEPPPREAKAEDKPAPAVAAAPPAAAAPVVPQPPGPPATISARVETGPDGTSIVFPFRARTPAAAYLRAGALTLVFDSRDRLDTAALAGIADPNLRPLDVQVEAGSVVLRFPEAVGASARLLAEGDGWRLAIGNPKALPADTLRVSRGLDSHGRALIRVGLTDAARAQWIREPDGARVAVVTAAGRVQALPLPRNFVEFGLVSTLHGLAVEARADDVALSIGQASVAIARDGGLSLSAPAGNESGGGIASRLVLSRETWLADVADTPWDRYSALIWDNAHSARAGRAASRFRLARFLVANGLNLEAVGILALASADDPLFARRREALLLSGIASVRARRIAEARAFLTAEGISEDPEAILWRAVADATDERWGAALAGFRRSPEVIALYPDELAGPIRLLSLTAALETGDVARAEGELAAIDRMAPGAAPRDAYDLARARVDDAAGRSEAAFNAYEMLAAEAELPVAAEATLRGVRLGVKTGAMSLETGIARLETLSVTWRGGELEASTVTDLARLYGEAKRWRDMFAMARRANRYFPRHPATRQLQEASAQQLEQLLLGAESGKLSGIQALSLYFDFRELAPVGRRGDELVRRLADRLVDLDLLEQAADLLQYQIDKRLTGAARATVAARLAAIRLMSGKPLLAIGALHSTRLAELPDEVRRFRYMLEARAQADLSRTELALEILESETGADVQRLRTSILWTARRWREAGEAGEALLGTRWEGQEPLSDRDRSDVLRAAIAYALADERMSLDRLKQKFGSKMLDSPDARTFDLVVSPGGVQTREFRLAAQEATKADSLRLLLADWRGRPVDAPAEPDGEEPQPAAPQVEGAARRQIPG